MRTTSLLGSGSSPPASLWVRTITAALTEKVTYIGSRLTIVASTSLSGPTRLPTL
jgi:hypothetical protein